MAVDPAASLSGTPSPCSCNLDVLRMLRLLRGLTLKEVADLTKNVEDATGKEGGISPAYLQQLERGKIQNPSPHNLYKLSRVLDFPYSKLMTFAGYAYGDQASGQESNANGSGGATGQNNGIPVDRLAALAEAVVDAVDDTAARDLVIGALHEYEQCTKVGLKPPPELVSTVLREYRRIHQAGGSLAPEDLTAAA